MNCPKCLQTVLRTVFGRIADTFPELLILYSHFFKVSRSVHVERDKDNYNEKTFDTMRPVGGRGGKSHPQLAKKGGPHGQCRA